MRIWCNLSKDDATIFPSGFFWFLVIIFLTQYHNYPHTDGRSPWGRDRGWEYLGRRVRRRIWQESTVSLAVSNILIFVHFYTFFMLLLHWYVRTYAHFLSFSTFSNWSFFQCYIRISYSSWFTISLFVLHLRFHEKSDARNSHFYYVLSCVQTWPSVHCVDGEFWAWN